MCMYGYNCLGGLPNLLHSQRQFIANCSTSSIDFVSCVLFCYQSVIIIKKTTLGKLMSIKKEHTVQKKHNTTTI